MKLHALLYSLVLCLTAAAQDFGTTFSNECLRLDYNFFGNNTKSDVALSNVQTQGEWAGRTNELSRPQALAYIMIEATDEASGECIFRASGNTLFDEWRATDEAKVVNRSMPYTMLMPKPLKPAIIRLYQTNSRHDTIASHTYRFDPSDILIRKAKPVDFPTRQLLKSGKPSECIDLVIVAEGYTKDEQEKFYADANRISDELFTYKPFDELRQHFNIIAVAVPSEDSETSYPKEGKWANTAFGSHFSTFYSDRYLTISNIPRIHDHLVGIPYDHIVALVNTKTYGGGGIYNMLTLTAADNVMWSELFVHELCHGLIGLADEYDYNSGDELYHAGVEPYEANLTTLVDFGAKWKDMYDRKEAELIEGGGYMTHTVYRPAKDCMMRSFQNRNFCPVCQRAIRRYVTGIK